MAAGAPPEGYVVFDYEMVKELLEKSIEFVEKKKNVKMDDNFFAKANIHITKKNRDTPEKRWIVSEQDTSQENFTDEPATYTFKSSFEERNSICLATSQGYSIGVGGGIGAGYVGGNAGLNTSLEYRQSKSFGQDQCKAEIKELVAVVPVPPQTIVVVKELVYGVERLAMCNLKLMLREKDKIFYKHTPKQGATEKSDSVEVKKLLQKAKQLQVKAPDPDSAQQDKEPCQQDRMPGPQDRMPGQQDHTPREQDRGRIPYTSPENI